MGGRERERTAPRGHSSSKFLIAAAALNETPQSMPHTFELSLRSKIAAGLLTALLVALVAGMSALTVSRAVDSLEEVNHSSEVLLEQQRLLRYIVDAETAARGYAITDTAAFIEPFDSAVVAVPRSIARLRAMMVDHPAMRPKLDSLESWAKLELSLNEQLIDIRHRQGFDAVQSLVNTGQSKGVMDQARKVAAEMAAEENRVLSERAKEQERDKTIAFLVIGIGGGLAFILSLLIMLGIRSDVNAREAQRVMIERQSREMKRQAQHLAVQRSESQALARQMTALLQSTEAGFYGMDREGNCTFINAAGAHMLGYEVGELIGKELHGVIHYRYLDGTAYPLEECPIFLASEGGKTAQAEDEVFWKKDGTPLAVEYSTSPIIDEGERRGAVVAFADITARKRQVAEREQLIKALARSNQELDQFAYVASHDLKAPLRGIANLSQWIEEDLGDNLAGENKSQMDLLRGRVHRMEALIDGILQYSRAGRVKSKPEPVDTGVLVREVIELIAPPPSIVIEVPPDMPTVRTEKVPLQQVFMNLIGNAIKHSRSEHAKIIVSWADSGEFDEFSVTDNGPGIAPQYHERIFGIFQTLEARDKVEGTGIGLSVVKKIVEAKGGKVEVTSDVGQGARFTFLWPREESTGA
jgi:PAS domain S-box-containing protein